MFVFFTRCVVARLVDGVWELSSRPTGRPESRSRGAPGCASPVICVFCLNYVVSHREALIGDVCAASFGSH